MKLSAPILLVLLAACHAAQPEQPRNVADPAVAEALAEPIMSDMDLQAAASPDALSVAEQPATMQIPAEATVDTRRATPLTEIASARVRQGAFAGCDAKVGYSAQWSVRLPDWIALPADARVAEAVGNDSSGCALRIVRFGLNVTAAQALARYRALADKAGFAVTTGKTALTAVRKHDGAAFHIDVVTIPGGTRIDLTSNRGR